MCAGPVVTLSRPVRLGKFDRVIKLKRGKIVFDGTPDEWRAASNEKSASTSAKHGEPAPMGGKGVGGP